MWAESVATKSNRSTELRKMGAFTVAEFAAKTGFTYNKAKGMLQRAKLKFEVAHDTDAYHGTQCRFYFPPK
jgi:hypothetical protein